jgi:hypothetical protein
MLPCALACLLSASAALSQSSCQLGWQPTFGGEPGLNGWVRALAEFDDGGGAALYAGGDFSAAGGVVASRVAKWDGSSWSSLGSGMDGGVYALAVHDDGGGSALFAGGIFTQADGAPASFVAKWDGSSWSAVGGGMNQAVLAFAVFDDGGGPALFAAGRFTSAGGAAANRIAKWDGVSWSALGAGASNAVNALAVFDDGGGPALFAGGEFTLAGGGAANRVAKWDGASWSALGSGTDNWVYALATHDDGGGGGPALFAGGLFTTAGGLAASHVAKWNGVGWSALAGGTNSEVRALAEYDDGNGARLYAGGSFATAGLVVADHVASWNGSSWAALGCGTNDDVLALAVHDDGGGGGSALFTGGVFTTADDEAATRIASFSGAGWSSLGSGLNASIYTLAPHDDGGGGGTGLYAGGVFTSAGGVAADRVARWDGSGWAALSGGVFGGVFALATHDDGGGSGSALYVGGSFTTAGGAAVNRIARWDGASWSTLASGMNSSVHALAVHDDGGGPDLYAGGIFTTAGGVSARRIASWDGASWSPLGTGILGAAYALVTHDDGGGAGNALYMGGSFFSAGGVTAGGIARWDGASWAALGSGMNGVVRALAVFDDGSGAGAALYAGGNFTTAGGLPADRVARWDGTGWSALGGGLDGEVRALAVHDDGSGPRLFAGGDFSAAGGVAMDRVARWDGTSWSALAGGVSDEVYALAVHTDGGGSPALYAGGAFSAAPSGDSYLARWGVCSGPLNYCTAGTSGSGCLASLSASGTPSASASSGFDLTAVGVEGNKDGLFFFGTSGRQANPWGNGTSLQCVAPPVKRGGLLAGTGTSGACNGTFTQDLNARWNAKPNQNPGPGAIVQAQLWYRDPFGSSNQTTSFSDALEFPVGP